MKIGKFMISAAMAAILLTGCGGSSKTYDFSDKDLSHAILVKESVLDSLSLQPTEKNVIQKFSNIDEYKYVFERSGGADNKEMLYLTTQDDIVCSIRLNQTGSIRSEYNILGIHTGDSRSSAESAGKAYFGEDGAWSKSAGIESVSFGAETSDKGFLMIFFDPGTDKVSSVSYKKEPKK